jgi:glycosyltransferase involved in cell wall biosynthesis
MRDGPRRILFVDSCPGIAGGQFSLLEILKTLDRSRFTAMVASAPGSGLRDRCADLGIPWFELPFQSAHISCDVGTSAMASIKDAWRSLRGVRTLAGLIRQEKIDIVHTNNFKATLVASFAAFITRRPMIFHDRIMLRHWPLGSLAALMSSRVIAISEAVRAKRGWPVSKKVVLIPPGIDTGRFAPVRQEEPSRRVCYIGRITEEKGIDYLLEAAALVVGQVPDARFVIAGSPFTREDGIYLEGLNLLIAQLGLKEYVELPGQVDDVRGLLAGCDLLVLPSRREGLGRVVLEAAAMEKPVVASATGGLNEIIRDGDNGFLVAPGDIKGLAGAMVRLLTDKDLAARMGQSGRNLVTSAYSNEEVACKVMGVYDEILEGKA